MNFKKLLINSILFLTFIIPINTFAYSSEVIVGGENIGIKVNTKYISIAGFYKVGNKYIGNDAGLEVGDYITQINGKSVSTIDDMVSVINNASDKSNIQISFLRNNKTDTTTLNIVQDENNVYKTGLYVKDTITGIGTLTFIDPTTKVFGALGHEILDKNTGKKVEIKDGKIFSSVVTSITKSENGIPGEKNARFDSSDTHGTILSNSQEGIFGVWEDELPDKYVSVANLDEVQLGSATIRTVIDNNEKKDYAINILEIDKNSETKNILFEIVDVELLNKTNGVVAGMSGSPILQNDKIIGAVTHVVVSSPHKGYAIGIVKMLENSEE